MLSSKARVQVVRPDAGDERDGRRADVVTHAYFLAVLITLVFFLLELRSLRKTCGV